MEKEKICLIVLTSAKELGKKINNKLQNIRNNNQNYVVEIIEDRFSNGEGKITLTEEIRGKKVYVLSDVGNYQMTYQMHGKINCMSPDDHFQDIKRVISAIQGSAEKITVIMPLLYSSRQHRRHEGESMDCVMALVELKNMGVDHIITIDAHDKNVSLAIPNIIFDNLLPSNEIINEIKKEESQDLFVISPDIGAVDRAKAYAIKLKCDLGLFHKRRDTTKVINGKNPIIEHVYLGENVKGKNVIIVDDMIASGLSILETAKNLKEQGANKIYLTTTFAFFTEGIELFDEAYKNNYFDKLFTTNASFIDKNIKAKKWYQELDCSSIIASQINSDN